MNVVLKIFLSMSFSGSLLILTLLMGKRFLKDKISRRWQYYIWLAVVLRLLLPFAPQGNLMGKAYQAVDQAITQAVSLQQEMPEASGDGAVSAVVRPDYEYADRPAQDSATVYALQDIGALLINHIWLVWLAAAFGMLLRKITIYQGFMRYIRAGFIPVSDMEMLDQLCAAEQCAGVYKPVELCVNPLVSSPMLLGFFHPCIVLPSADISGQDFTYIALHELMHYKRRDLFYKWLVQVTVCLHWFNPFVYLMSREITRACELSCDEAVLLKIGGGNAQDYGRTLLDAMAAVGKYKENPGAVTLSENKQLLKERLGAIMNYKKKSKAIWLLTGVLTLCVMFGAVFVGVYPASAAADGTTGKSQAAVTKKSTKAETGTQNKNYASQAERYYKAGSLPLFQIAFSRLDEKKQGEWLDKIYADQNIMFMGAAASLLEEDCTFIRHLAEKTYKRNDIVFFSIAVTYMSEDMLEGWLDRAVEDDNWAFQSVLYQALDKDDEFDGLEEKLAKAQMEEYEASGVTFDGKNYYYRGKLVDIFLDERGNQSYFLDMNPAGTVNIKIKRNADGKITGVAYMTEAEVIKLFGDREDDPENKVNEESVPVDLKTVAAGKTVLLGEYTLSDGDKIWYDITAETGKGMEVYFTKDGRKNPRYWRVHNVRQQGEPLQCAADFTVHSPAEPGTYQLFLRASDGALKKVTGSICSKHRTS